MEFGHHPDTPLPIAIYRKRVITYLLVRIPSPLPGAAAPPTASPTPFGGETEGTRSATLQSMTT